MEHAKLERAFQCSKHILEYVNQAVKEYENHYKLEHLQRKIEKKSDSVSNQEDSRQIKVGFIKCHVIHTYILMCVNLKHLCR
jgi:seryl-tRNA(Sec) selenium transferase